MVPNADPPARIVSCAPEVLRSVPLARPPKLINTPPTVPIARPPLETTMPPPSTVVLTAVPATLSKPPESTVPVVEPPADTISVAPEYTVVLRATPPASMNSWPATMSVLLVVPSTVMLPLLMVLIAVPPLRTVIESAGEIVRPLLVWPPETIVLVISQSPKPQDRDGPAARDNCPSPLFQRCEKDQ